MGLSTAQARLLTITARKSDCEFLSMNLSHQKIALSRNMEMISTIYQNSLNKTKLVYDYYGSGKSQMDLTYGLLMTPSVYNDYFPKLVTDNKNRVVLNSAYAEAARAAGIPAEGLSGTPSSDVRNAFLEALAIEKVITPQLATTIQGVTYQNALGVGATSGSTVGTTSITYDELLDMIDAQCVDTNTWVSPSGQPLNLGQGEADYAKENSEHMIVSDSVGAQVQQLPNDSSTAVSLADLLKHDKEYNLAIRAGRGEKAPLFAGKELQEKIVGEGENSPSVLNWMFEQFSSILGGTSENDLALQYAYNQVFDLLYPSNKLIDVWNKHKDQAFEDKGDKKEWCNSRNSEIMDALNEIGTGQKIHKTSKFYVDKVVNSKNYLGFLFTFDYDHKGFHADRKDRSQISINLNNIADVFLTSFVQYQKGLENSDYIINKGNKGNSNLYDPNDDDFVFNIPVDTSAGQGESNCVEASFYDTLFNRICLDGWVQNDQIDDKEYMQEMMKSGMLYISSISDDGYYYQGNYATDKYITEITDDVEIAKAEAKYNTEKTRIQNKEENIDMKMKNLDTEISSLTTEYDTTKSVLTKNIEKSFKRYDA